MTGRNRSVKALVALMVIVAVVMLARVGPTRADGRRSRATDGADTIASTTATVQLAAEPLLPEGEIRERNIAFYESRLAADPEGAIDRRNLASLLMGRARGTGSVGDYTRAESLLRASLAIREQRNSETFALLASALLARHDFVGALAVATRADSLDPGVPAQVALLGEIELEMGDYASAQRHFSALRYHPDQFTIAARLARWQELTGHADSARTLLRLAVARVARRDDLPREQVAWFHYRLGELDQRTGALDSADASYKRGLIVFPDDYRILGGLARLAATRGDWATAIDYGNRAVAIQLDPATLGTISDAYAASGDTAQARQYAKAMTVSALRQPGPIHRAWGLFLLDHGTARDARAVLAKVRTELASRQDVYGYDLLAWALHRRGDDRAAQHAMERALSQHTEDAQLYVHAAAIATSLGDDGAARDYLATARRVNPHYRATERALVSLASVRMATVKRG